MKSINLLPSKNKTNAQSGLLVPLLIGILIAGLGVQGFFLWTWNQSEANTVERINELNHEISEIRSSGMPLSVIEGYRQSQQLAADLEQQRQNWKPYLDVVVNELPSKAKVITMNADGSSKLTVELDFPTHNSAIAYMQTLENNDKLKDVLMTSYYKRAESEPIKKTVFKLLLTIDLNMEKGAVN